MARRQQKESALGPINIVTALSEYQLQLKSQSLRAAIRVIEGKCEIEGCNRPPVTKWHCAYHRDLKNANVRAWRKRKKMGAPPRIVEGGNPETAKKKAENRRFTRALCLIQASALSKIPFKRRD